MVVTQGLGGLVANSFDRNDRNDHFAKFIKGIFVSQKDCETMSDTTTFAQECAAMEDGFLRSQVSDDAQMRIYHQKYNAGIRLLGRKDFWEMVAHERASLQNAKHKPMPSGFGPFDEDVSGIVIGELTSPYQFWIDEPRPERQHKTGVPTRLVYKGSFRNDEDAIAWFKENYPDEFKHGVEMRAYDG